MFRVNITARFISELKIISLVNSSTFCKDQILSHGIIKSELVILTNPFFIIHDS